METLSYCQLMERCIALAAENAELKNFISEECLVRNPLSRNQLCAEDVSDALAPETPATDAFLAEVRAQGVEMFAAKCKEESKRVHSSDYRDSWWVSGENAEDFAAQLRQEAAQ